MLEGRKPLLSIGNNLVLNSKAREWCKLPYPDHPKGCPNFAHKLSCPPEIPTVDKVFDLARPLWFVVVEFNLGEHMVRLKTVHPNWSDRQLRCVLYWQNSVNATLKALTEGVVWATPGSISTLCPEGMGVFVIATAQRLGLPIKVKPTETVYKIALVGFRVLKME